ncbi:hypothetical protein Tsubulata_019840 [Turnera subulata]|uniref:Lipoxygenase n=1 Tax=Turnera subulata TaxID=218843 RepID=A0A9Q0F0K9_9ROSI|nr:hypothetical protein Tsubulata_019840 [Turnera subulata]
MAQRIIDAITGHHGDDMKSKRLKGVVILMLKKNILGFNDIAATVLDSASEFLGNVVSLQLISSANSDVNSKGKLGEPAYLEYWDSTVTPLTAGEEAFRVKFDWNEEDIGTPGAVIIRNNHHSEFYLKSLTLEDVPGEGRLHFVCNSWIYPAKRYKNDRIFFTNKAYLPHETPKPLLKYREEELVILRGDGEGQLHEWDRVYDYAYYNDLGDPDKGPSYARPVLGGSAEYPYPRRGRTGKAATKSDPHSESRLPLLLSLNIYVPRDERFNQTKMSDFLASGFTSVAHAIKNSKLFILDHHDVVMPYLRRINTTSTKTYASRTLLFLKEDGCFKPIAIELSLPHPEGDKLGAISKVYTPSDEGVEGSIWQLAKAYVAVNDSGRHQLISHWLSTHGVIEPFIIAANRQLSVLHPIYKLLHPHFRDTMNINAFARIIVISAGGVLESTVFPSRYAMEMSSAAYKSWVFTEQAVPEDLKKRGMAVEDPNAPHGLRLLIQDYPYAVDGLEIWFAIKGWVEDYCSYYYKTDEMVQKDSELQSWWKELREEGHADIKNEPRWPKMKTVDELTESCTTIIWVASALHASVNFGQYSYAGYNPNRPSMSRRFMPEEGTPEYEELKENPDKVFRKTITPQLQTFAGISLIEILCKHSSDEVYLGQRDTAEWTADAKPLEAFERFGKKLSQIEETITKLNQDKKLKNRVGPVNVPYTLLFPTSEMGLTGKGIPNSTTI